MSTLGFLKQFILTPNVTGAVAPSSQALAEVMVDAAGVGEADVVVEFGPGTGVFTEVIIRKLPEDSHFFAIEINPMFVELVRKRCPGVLVYEDSATNTAEYLNKAGFNACDCIVSGLPWASFDDELQDALLDTVLEVLKPDGRFVTFAYVQSPFLRKGRKFRDKLEKRFGNLHTTRTVWRNIPPAFAYCATK